MIGVSNLGFKTLRIMPDALDSNNQHQHLDHDDDVMLVVKEKRVLRKTHSSAEFWAAGVRLTVSTSYFSHA